MSLIVDVLRLVGIDVKLWPVLLTSNIIESMFAVFSDARTRAADMGHAVRDHIE
ncbi:hypothetical protein HUX53_33485, partial [Actinomadura sp. BRA 177]|nr:hypothetical protein [Actinomadura sp. BRA 177]